ncbi:MAG: hypothetical protein AB7P22_01730 [Vicinamibacterales bacterium]
MSSPRLQPGVEVHSVEDGCVVWVPATDQVHFLNDTAMHILDMCDGTLDVTDLQAELGDPGEIGFDVAAILGQFEAAKIVAFERGSESSRS